MIDMRRETIHLTSSSYYSSPGLSSKIKTENTLLFPESHISLLTTHVYAKNTNPLLPMGYAWLVY